MAGEAPIYESTQRVPEGPQALITPQAPDYSAIGTSIEKFGSALNDYQAKLATAQQATDKADKLTQHLVGVSDLEKTYTESTDFNNAPGQFAAANNKLMDGLLSGVMDDQTRAELRLSMTRTALSAQNKVNQKQLGNWHDDTRANLDTGSATTVRNAVNAGSSVERAAIIDGWNKNVDALAATGAISKVEAVQRKVVAGQTLDDADALALIQINPRQAAAELSDPEKFKNLGAIQRQNLMTQAQAKADQLYVANAQNVAMRDPARGVLMVGKVGRAEDADAVFNRGILSIENAKRDNSLVSSAGAVGVSQIMPGTARDVAHYLGDRSLDGLDDAATTERLKADPALNLRLGTAYWRGMVARYDGNVDVAAAAYNAGPGRADKWVQQAVAQFGTNYSPAQFASVVDIKETRNYIDRLHTTLGAPLDAGLTPSSQLHAASVVGAAISQQESERVSALRAAASMSDLTSSPIDRLKAGYNVDPAEVATWRQSQTLAAMSGDVEANKRLNAFNLQYEMLPARQKGMRTPVPQLEQWVGEETARLHGLPDVSTNEKNRLDIARETLKTVKEARDSNIIGLAEQAQFVPAAQRVVIDPQADPRSNDFVGALAIRNAQANNAAQFYQGKAIALKPQETAALKERWANAGPDDRFQMLRAFGTALTGNAYGETLKAVTGDSGVMATIGRVAVAQPDIARQILIGDALLKDKDVSTKAETVKGAFASKMGGQLYPDPAMQKSVEDAALRLYVARSGGNGTLYDPTDSGGIERAIEDIAGPIVKRNGVKVPVAPGIDRARFTGALDNLTQADLNLMGGALDRNGAEISPAAISDHAILKPLAPGSSLYVVGMRDARASDGFAPVFTRSEQPTPLVFNMAALARNHVEARFQSGDAGKVRAMLRGQAAARIRQTVDAVRDGDAQP